jgi:hypothetical protein
MIYARSKRTDDRLVGRMMELKNNARASALHASRHVEQKPGLADGARAFVGTALRIKSFGARKDGFNSGPGLLFGLPYRVLRRLATELRRDRLLPGGTGERVRC